MTSTKNHRITALYCRLSRDDDYHGDSASIQTQKLKDEYELQIFMGLFNRL